MKASDQELAKALMALPQAEREHLLEFLGIGPRDAAAVEEMLDSLHASFKLKRGGPNQRAN